MMKEYTAEENQQWLDSQPKKMVVVKVIIRSEENRVLLVKPNYKKSWQLPGGGVDSGESPEEALVREVSEELGLSLNTSDISLKGTVYKKDEEILFLIYEYLHKLSENTKLRLQEDEVTASKYFIDQEVADLLSDYYRPFWSNYLDS